MAARTEDHESDVELASESASNSESEWTDESETAESGSCALPAQEPVYDDHTINWIITAHNHTMLNKVKKMKESIVESKELVESAQARLDAAQVGISNKDRSIRRLAEIHELMERGETDAAREAFKAELEVILPELGEEGLQMLRRAALARAGNAEDPVASRSEG